MRAIPDKKDLHEETQKGKAPQIPMEPDSCDMAEGWMNLIDYRYR